MNKRSEELESIPGIGNDLAAMLRSIGVRRVSDLKGVSPEELYKRLEQTTGAHVDRCVLYAFRNAVYFASHERHNPAKLKWWYWKDKQQLNSMKGKRRNTGQLREPDAR